MITRFGSCWIGSRYMKWSNKIPTKLKKKYKQQYWKTWMDAVELFPYKWADVAIYRKSNMWGTWAYQWGTVISVVFSANFSCMIVCPIPNFFERRGACLVGRRAYLPIKPALWFSVSTNLKHLSDIWACLMSDPSESLFPRHGGMSHFCFLQNL